MGAWSAELDRLLTVNERNEPGHPLPVRTRLGITGGSQRMHQARHRRRLAGHMAGHGKLGAAAGCAVGHHEVNKHNPNNSNAEVPAGQK